MGNPYAARSPVRVSHETVSELDALLARLEMLGATADELDQVRDGWDDLDDDWTLDARHRFAAASDGELVAQINSVREEYRQHTTTPEDDAVEHTRRTEEAYALVHAHDIMSGTVAKIVDWVGDDEARAFVVHDLEANGQGRKTLIEAVESSAAAWAVHAQ